MLAKCVQVSVEVSVTESSFEGKVFVVGGKPQERGQVRWQESLPVYSLDRHKNQWFVSNQNAFSS